MIPYNDEGMVKTVDHFGTKQENPEGFADLKNSLLLLDKRGATKKSPVWAYDSDGFAEEFVAVMRELGVDEDAAEFPDEVDMEAAGFEVVETHRDTVYMMKPGTNNFVVVIENSSAGVPPMVVFTK